MRRKTGITAHCCRDYVPTRRLRWSALVGPAHDLRDAEQIQCGHAGF
jgi:hypothetical protein